MKSFKVLFIVAMLAAGPSAFAQQTIVKGVLTDSLTNEGEPYATVRVFKEKDMSKPVAMSITDLEGAFSQPVAGEGNFTIMFSSVGKVSVLRRFTLHGQATLDLGTIRTREDMQTLEGVEVVAQKPLVKMEVDKMSYSVADDVDAQSNTILDMLRKVPMVTVDGQDNIAVNGSSNFKVYVDGKPNVMISANPSQILKNMPASMVKSIEVVTNPGAKYDAEGVGGVLNIILNGSTQGAKEKMNGYNGNIRATVGTKSQGAGGFVSLQRNNVSLSTNLIYNHSKLKDTEMAMDRTQYADTDNSLTNFYQKMPMENNFKMGNLTFSWDVDSVSNLGLSASFTDFDNDVDGGQATTRMSGGIYHDGFGYSSLTTNQMRNTSFNGSVDYQRFLGNRERSITLSYLFTSTPTKDDAYTTFDRKLPSPYLDLTDRYSHGKNKTSEHIGQIDFTAPIAKGQTFNVGGKYTSHSSSSKSSYYLKENGIYTYNQEASLYYKHHDDILAGYVEYDGKFGRFGFKGGIRYEHTWQDVAYVYGAGSDFTKKYGNLVPSANLQYTLSPFSNLGLTYNLRISRPGISYLNPYINRTDPTSLVYGNTDLDVEETHHIRMVYNLFGSKFMMNVSLRQSFCNNAIEEYRFYKNNLLNTTYGNIVENRQTGMNSYINWALTKHIRLIFNGEVSYTDLRSSMLETTNNGWQANAMIGMQQTLPANIRLSLNTMVSTKKYNLQGYNSGFNMLMGSLNKAFLKDRLNVSLTGITPYFSKLKIKNFSKGKEFESRQVVRIPLHMVMLNVSWSFGNSRHQVRQHTSNISNDDYIEHKSDSEQINSYTGN